MSRALPLILLVCLLLLGTAVTLLNTIQRESDAVEVTLGIEPAPTPQARYLDDLVLKVYESNALSDELKQRLNKPAMQTKLKRFFMDACEVSQKEYEQYIEWNKRMTSAEANDLPEWMKSASSGHRIAGQLQSAATGISMQGATAYCQTADGRLPYVEELEVAANGDDNRLYPWGNEFTDKLWPYASADRNANQSCKSHADLATEDGAHHLVSNAMEWTQGSIARPSELSPPIAFGAPATRSRGRELYALNASWFEVEPQIKSHHLGFRCVYDNVPPVVPWTFVRPEFIYVGQGTFEIGLPQSARLPLFVANMPKLKDLNLRQLLVNEGEPQQVLNVDQCEVSRGQFKKFLNDPLVQLGLLANDNEPEEIDYVPVAWEAQQDHLDLPVYGVNWWAADAYARWVGGRLPTIREWRQIALGTDGSRYPWGESYGEPKNQVGDHADSSLRACGIAQTDITLSGIHDLGGNLSEWTRSVTMNRGSVSIWVAGGNWILPGLETAQSVFGRPVPIGFQSETIGFRVVHD